MAETFVVVSKIKKVEQVLQESVNKVKTDGTKKTLGAEDL